jgi:hypothetical protein
MILAYIACEKVGKGAEHCHAALSAKGCVILGVVVVVAAVGFWRLCRA